MRRLLDQQSFPPPAIMLRISWPAIRRRWPGCAAGARSPTAWSVRARGRRCRSPRQQGLNSHVGVKAMEEAATSRDATWSGMGCRRAGTGRSAGICRTGCRGRGRSCTGPAPDLRHGPVRVFRLVGPVLVVFVGMLTMVVMMLAVVVTVVLAAFAAAARRVIAPAAAATAAAEPPETHPHGPSERNATRHTCRSQLPTLAEVTTVCAVRPRLTLPKSVDPVIASAPCGAYPETSMVRGLPGSSLTTVRVGGFVPVGLGPEPDRHLGGGSGCHCQREDADVRDEELARRRGDRGDRQDAVAGVADGQWFVAERAGADAAELAGAPAGNATSRGGGHVPV